MTSPSPSALTSIPVPTPASTSTSPIVLATVGSAVPRDELVSALVDGQATGQNLSDALAACSHHSAAAAQWRAYHLIGDVLRAPGSSALPANAAFVSRFSARLALENPAFTAPAAPAAPAALPANPERQRSVAANDGHFRWKLAAGFASLAAIASVGWNLAGLSAVGGASQLARGEPVQQIIVASPQGPVVRDARLEELLAAHRQLGATSALQDPAGFFRNATFEPAPAGPAR